MYHCRRSDHRCVRDTRFVPALTRLLTKGHDATKYRDNLVIVESRFITQRDQRVTVKCSVLKKMLINHSASTRGCVGGAWVGGNYLRVG